jgi:hypothetical protein
MTSCLSVKNFFLIQNLFLFFDFILKDYIIEYYDDFENENKNMLTTTIILIFIMIFILMYYCYRKKLKKNFVIPTSINENYSGFNLEELKVRKIYKNID